MTQGKPGKTTVFPQTRGRQQTRREGSVLGRLHGALLDYKIKRILGRKLKQ